jgi:hypothetical protein
MSIIGPSASSSSGLKQASAGGKNSKRPELVLSNSRRGYGSNTQYPKSLGRAAEEYVFLKVAFLSARTLNEATVVDLIELFLL